MRRVFPVFFLLLCFTSSIHGQKTRFEGTAQKRAPIAYTIKMHISRSHLDQDQALRVDAILNGKKFELQGPSEFDVHHAALIIPGDYLARLTRDIHNSDSTVIYQGYDVLLPNGTVWHCVTNGVSE